MMTFQEKGSCARRVSLGSRNARKNGVKGTKGGGGRSSPLTRQPPEKSHPFKGARAQNAERVSTVTIFLSLGINGKQKGKGTNTGGLDGKSDRGKFQFAPPKTLSTPAGGETNGRGGKTRF